MPQRRRNRDVAVSFHQALVQRIKVMAKVLPQCRPSSRCSSAW
jgi:hypothetical protein